MGKATRLLQRVLVENENLLNGLTTKTGILDFIFQKMQEREAFQEQMESIAVRRTQNKERYNAELKSIDEDLKALQAKCRHRFEPSMSGIKTILVCEDCGEIKDS
jgi:hypothetical protein